MMADNPLSRPSPSLKLNDALAYSIKSHKPLGFVVVMIDHLTSTHAHIANLTSQLYPRLKRTIRMTDSLVRFSDDCWVICLDDCNDQQVQRTQYLIQSVLNNLKGQLTSPLNSAFALAKGVCIRAKSFNQIRISIEQEIQLLRSQLRRLKMIRSTPLNSTPSSLDNPDHLISLVHRAILDNRLFLAFQPVLDNQSGEIKYYECLARILDEGGQILAAGQFIPVCEKVSLIHRIDQKIQQLAIAELMSNRYLRLAINVSAVTATDPVWLHTLKTQMTARPDLADRLIIELTETSIFYDIGESIRFIAQLRDLGCQVSIDDFGSGYMSLMHLKSDLIQIVKIDAQYITSLASKPDNIHFIRALLALTQPQGIKCVAEGIEDAQAIAILAHENIHYLQGYYIGKPCPIRSWI